MSTAITEWPEMSETLQALYPPARQVTERTRLGGHFLCRRTGYLTKQDASASATLESEEFRNEKDEGFLDSLILGTAGLGFYIVTSESSQITTGKQVTILQFGERPNITFALDFGEPVDAFPSDQQEVVEHLRANGRPVLASKLDTMLQDVKDDPNEPEINFIPLRDMAQLLVEQARFADPFVCPDGRGAVHAHWKIDGNGALFWGFLGNERILVVAQADATQERGALDISTIGDKKAILEEFQYLVPLRD
jgi:hypothetical protein